MTPTRDWPLEYYVAPGARETCHAVRHPDTRRRAVEEMARALSAAGIAQPGDLIVPAPQHGGRAEYTLDVAERVALGTGAEVADVLGRRLEESLYESRRSGRTSPSPTLYLAVRPPTGRRMLFLDNVISTGATYLAARELLGEGLLPFAYAVDGKRLRDEVTLAAIEEVLRSRRRNSPQTQRPAGRARAR